MKNNNYYCVIMAGGIGSRFWPMSTPKLPKQFHDILGTGKTLIQQTFHRISKIIPIENIYIITNEEYVNLTLEQLPEISKSQVIGEPKMMNTSACNIYMAEKIYNLNPDSCIIVAPSDHLILNEDEFSREVLIAFKKAEKQDILVTLGITPHRPDTGYGYIEFSENEKSTEAYKVKSFKEKPDLETAKSFLKSKNFLWNSGIFIWSSKNILNSFQLLLPEMYEKFQSIKTSYNTPNENIKIREVYNQIEKVSIDYGILEKSSNVWVIPSSFGWNDLGTWNALYENLSKDNEGNAIYGKNIHAYNSSNNILKTTQIDKTIIIDGLKDYIVVDTDDALLVCPRESDQEIKNYLKKIRTID
ncbi:mannose-1-phosphate guanylyltransferase [Apibacter muscae]|uniref:mannose-1-phosphate guanylyltransferase n=1 Tax=Apibacter muscae TaxID=2509004 RepID=UPI0011AD86D9|nr:sugar phosphate nucleotidyltransferase [Apibacter muscae]TWP24731.1 mannose-1-phosphate guanylyltransferase [Apibacter muscae]